MFRLTLTTFASLVAPALAALVLVFGDIRQRGGAGAQPVCRHMGHGADSPRRNAARGRERSPSRRTATRSPARCGSTGPMCRSSNVRENGGIISFSAPSPGSPGLVLNYSGAIQGNQLGVASQDLGSGSYTLTARRTRGAPQAQVAQTAPAAPPRGRRRPPPHARAGTATTRPAGGTGGPARPRCAAAGIGRSGSDGAGRLCRAPARDRLRRRRRQPPRRSSSTAAAASRRQRAAAARLRPRRRAPPQRRHAAPEPPPAPGPDLEGSWSAEQTTPGSIGPSAATLELHARGRPRRRRAAVGRTGISAVRRETDRRPR